MNKTKIFLAVCAGSALLSLWSCGSKSQKPADETVAEEVVADSASYLGTYEGTFPCADCGGKVTELTLNEDTTYDLNYRFEGKKDAPVHENGTYEVQGDSLIICVTPSSGYKTYYRVVEEGVALTDSTGKLNAAELAPFYVLKKK